LLCFKKKKWLKTKAISQRDAEKLLKKASARKFQCQLALAKSDIDIEKGGN